MKAPPEPRDVPLNAQSRIDYKRTRAPVSIFVIFAHKDEKALTRLDDVLSLLERNHDVAAWRDKRLIAGEEWDTEIRQRLEQADIFLFIASQSSLVRPYIRDVELHRAIERREAGDAEVAAVKLEPCAYDEDPVLGKLQRLASKIPSIAEARHKSTAWEEVRKDLLSLVHRVRSGKALSVRGDFLGISTRTLRSWVDQKKER